LAAAPARPSKQSLEGTESQTTTTTTPPPRQMSCGFTPLLAILDLEKVELWQLEMAPKKTDQRKMEPQGFKLDHKPITARSPCQVTSKE